MGTVLNALGGSGITSALTSPQFKAALRQFQQSIPGLSGALTIPSGQGTGQPPTSASTQPGILSSLLTGAGNALGNSTLYNLGSNPQQYLQQYLKNLTGQAGLNTSSLVARQGGS